MWIIWHRVRSERCASNFCACLVKERGVHILYSILVETVQSFDGATRACRRRRRRKGGPKGTEPGPEVRALFAAERSEKCGILSSLVEGCQGAAQGRPRSSNWSEGRSLAESEAEGRAGKNESRALSVQLGHRCEAVVPNTKTEAEQEAMQKQAPNRRKKCSTIESSSICW